MTSSSPVLHKAIENPEWWRTAVIYQIYPRSFADGNGDGMGDLKGVTERLESLAELGIDAIWFSPFFKSPQRDAGYDVSDYTDIDPLFGTLADFDRMLSRAKALKIRIIVDLVPNHSSDQHELFQAALAAGPGSAEREMYMFRDGQGRGGELPPNNWESVFGGSAWTRIVEPDGRPGQWYLHIFDSSQPDFNWDNPKVSEFFDDVLRFWLDRGVDGFRIDVAHGLKKAPGLPDVESNNSTMAGVEKTEEEAELEALYSDWIETESNAYWHFGSNPEEVESGHPFWGLDAVHPIIRGWRKILDSYDGDRAMCAEAWVLPLSRMARWVRPDEYHQTFNFGYLETPWDPKRLFKVVTESLREFGKVGAPSTWVLSNHDVIRHVSRFGLAGIPPQGDGLGPASPQPDEALGLRRGRAASAFMLGLPGGAYIYQGEELGLPEHTTLPDSFRQDPTFFRTGGKRVGRDGCRVPLPWEAHGGKSLGFNTTGETWLPQPSSYQRYARDVQTGIAGSTLELYKRLIHIRREHGMGGGEFRWAPEYSDKNTLAFINNGVLVLSNFTGDSVVVPAGEILVSTQADLRVEGELEHDQTVWIKL